MSLTDVRKLPASEITLWLAYFKIKSKVGEEKPKSDVEGFKNLMNKKA